MRKLAPVLAIAAFLALVAALVLTPNERNRFALVVGAPPPEGSGLAPLKYADRDAARLGRVLAAAGFAEERTVVMTPETAARSKWVAMRPTAENIRAQLRRLAVAMRNGDGLVLAFSGHVVRTAGETGQVVLCPADVDFADPKSLLTLKELYAFLSDSKPAGPTVLLIDGFRADALLPVGPARAAVSAEPPPQFPVPPDGVSVVASAAPGQYSSESDDKKAGAFFDAAIEGVRGMAGVKGTVTAEDLSAFVATRLKSVRLVGRPQPDLLLAKADAQSLIPEPASGERPAGGATAVAPEQELQIEDIEVGTGATAVAGKTVSVHYTGTLTNGVKFDSSRDRNRPFTLQLGAGQVIRGWDEGLVGMKVGGKRKLTIPPGFGYGARPQGSIPANSTLLFDIELLEVK